ncbi:MAG TPA: 2OG-Fe(II) oxygenase [Candidatus Dormibacteraeota bacterium]|nr:2OG-Fe(II) oxygenase [Candidatus Dormibacteraeota bacterium]
MLTTARHLDGAHLRELAADTSASYRSAQPFPHTVIEDLVDPELAARLVEEFPRPADIAWQEFQSENELKLATNDEAKLGPATVGVLRDLTSSRFVDFLERLTGIEGLVPDPHHVGGGLHQIKPGGYLRIHADFNKHPRLHLDRRLNLILFLNPGWREEWGGHLELWDREMHACERRVLPVLNRCVIFNTTSWAYHGHPSPLTCPPEVTRRSLALYYYTNGRPAADGPQHAHSTLFKRSAGERRTVDGAAVRATLDRVARDVTPPVVVRGLRSLRARRRARDGHDPSRTAGA